MADPRNTSTVQDFINNNDIFQITYNNLSYIQSFNNIDFPMYNVFNDYIREFTKVAETVTLSEKEQFKYKYKPKLLANDLYNNPELYFVILAINNMGSVKEFNISKVKLLKIQYMEDMLKALYTVEKKMINEYNERKK